MNELKQIFDNEVENILPENFRLNVQHSVMNSIRKEEKSISFQFLTKEQFIFGCHVSILTLLVYFLGFHKSTAIRLYIDFDFVWNSMKHMICGGVIFLVFVHEYFDRKKKALI